MNENKRKLQETVKCEDSFQYFLDNYVKVNNMDGLTCFETKQYQQQFVKNLETRNLNILFGERQKGKTTIALSHALYFGLFNPNKSIAVIGNKLTLAKQILEVMKGVYSNIEGLILPKIIEASKKSEIRFNNGSVIRGYNGNEIKGTSIHYLLMDEVSYRKDINELYENIAPIVLSSKNSKMTIIKSPINVIDSILLNSMANSNSSYTATVIGNKHD